MSPGGRDRAPVARGVFARFDGQQRWAAGTPAALRGRDPAWLEKWFPVPSRVPPRDGGRGALWIRWMEGSWFVCHACVPAWSMDRSIPAWVVSQIDPGAFDALAVLAGECEAAEAASGSERAARAWPAEMSLASASEWHPSALTALAAFFDIAALAADDAPASGHRLPAEMLDRGGWIALQAILGAMREAGVPSACAVVLGDPAWVAAVRQSLSPDTYMFLPGLARVPASGDLRSRGVALSRFIDDLPSARGSVVSAAASGTPGRRFVDALAGAVPLQLVDAALVEPRECQAWAARVADAAGGTEPLAAAVDGLVARARGGEETVIGPALSLAGRWAQAAGPRTDVRSRMDSWVAPLLRRG